MNESQKTLAGTEAKIAVTFDYPADPDVTLDDIEFKVEFFCRPTRKVVLDKSELIREEIIVEGVPQVNWYAIVDTAVTGRGIMKMAMKAEIPVADGIRIEYAEVVVENPPIS